MVKLQKISMKPITDSIIEKYADLQDYPIRSTEETTVYKGYIGNWSIFLDFLTFDKFTLFYSSKNYIFIAYNHTEKTILSINDRELDIRTYANMDAYVDDLAEFRKLMKRL